MRRAIADMALDDDQARPIVDPLGNRDRLGDPLAVVGVADPLHVPAIGEKPPATSSVKARAVLPSIVMWLLS